MRENVYRATFLVHLTIWIAFPVFTFADDSSIEKESEAPHYREIIESLTKEPSKKLPREERAQAFMYLGYSRLNLGDKSGAYEHFIKAFRLDPYLEFEKGVVRDTSLEGIIKEAQVALQIERQLDLFVAVDLSTSIPEGQVLRIMELQRGVLGKLKETDRVSCYGFGDFKDRDSNIPYPVYSPSSVSIVDSLRSDSWTDFSTLFSRLEASITRDRGESDDTGVSQKAVLIISDGKHSVKNEEGAEEGKISQSVTNAIKKFSESCQNVPIVVVTISRDTYYADLWTEEIKKHPDSIGKGFSYGLRPEPQQDILDQIFGVIMPDRLKMIVARDPKDENKGDAFINGSCTVGVLIQCPFPKAYLRVTGSPLWGESSDTFRYEWEAAKKHPKDLRIITCSGNLHEKVKITRLTDENSSASMQQGPRIIKLTFSQSIGQGIDEEKIGEVSMLFKESQPTLQITRRGSIIRWWDKNKTVILKSDGSEDLKFQAKIDLSDHHFKLPIPLNVTVRNNKCFSRLSKTEFIPIDTTGSPGQHEFNLSIKAKRIDGFPPKLHCEGIGINFEIDDGSTKDRIDDRVGKINFKVVSELLYYLYRINQLIWFPIACIFFFCLFSLKSYQITPNNTSTSVGGFKVFGNTIYDGRGKLVLRLRRRYGLPALEHIEGNLIRFLGWPKGVLPITSQGNEGLESRFNIHWKDPYRAWYEMVERFVPYFSVFFFILISVWLYVSWPLSIVNLIILLLLFVLIVLYLVRLDQRRKESGLYEANIFRTLGGGFSLLEAGIGFVERLLQLFI